ncbi:GNAT family N-acetyltransferase [Flexivirga endophytica]|uniref:GNAT family N-acetyltransferase n=1 Tax=Flexivirga endophytica TaxID=1849103 RepID=A0A916SXP9_9MICO|nr:bifunctional GNAT family N-acetyltransferase/acetate--CoA ligase family protein [Flexivirga endophytica]GGB20977.1 GNAT family N-acetyltransferase [Flexivirga endophytica]GHB58759.1 GNAT family N-acetyltransferase [Flexivirga endophytica]
MNSTDDRSADELPPGYPREWEADVVLRDGSVAQVRPIRPDDVELLQEFHERQSDESIYLRFFAPLKHLSDREATRFANVDYSQRVALIVEAGGRMVGVARYDRLTGPDGPQAEVAFNIADDFQGRGVGSVLLEHLAAIGAEAGVQEFVADVLPQNHKMMGVFTDAGFEVRRRFDDGVMALTFRIEPTEQSQAVRTAREQRAEARSMRSLLAPSSIAVVGVGSRPTGLGRGVFEHLQAGGFTGALYAVNRNVHHEIRDVTVHPSVKDLPGPVELVVIAVPAPEVLQVVHECAEHDVKALVVISAGFAEAGPEGEQLQAELLSTARRHGMRVAGPNSFGLINTREDVRMNATLAPEMPGRGRFGLFAQSGALGIAVLDFAERRGLGLTDFVSTGNRVDVSGNDVMQAWMDDDRTEAVGLYLESMGNPRKFSRIARRLSLQKPVIVVKSGVSSYGVPPGHRVRPTHISPDAFSSMLRQAGVIRVENLHQMFDVAQLVVNQPIPQGPRVAIVGNSDALGALAADNAISLGLQITHGPVNLPAECTPEQLEQAVDAAFADPDVDSVVTAFMQPVIIQGIGLATALAKVSARHEKPCLTTFLGISGVSEVLAAPHPETQIEKFVPSYAVPEDGVRALAAVTRYGEWRGTDRGTPVLPEGIDRRAAEHLVDRVLAASPDGRPLTAPEVRELLAAYGIDVWPYTSVRSADEAVQVAEEMGYPVVVKSVSPLVRTQPVTAVRADLTHAAAVHDAYTTLDERLRPLHANRLVVQRMATPGIPCIVATGEDPLFGPVVRFSLAGAPTEVMGDLAYRIPPLTEVDVRDLINSVRAAPLLHGRGGGLAVDQAALEDVVARISVLAEHLPDVAALELNPVNTHAGGLEVLGATVTVAPPAVRTDSGRRSLPRVNLRQ